MTTTSNSSEEVEYFLTEFMPRIKGSSKEAMLDVILKKKKVVESAKDNKVSHQSLSKNMNRYKELSDQYSDLRYLEFFKVVLNSKTMKDFLEIAMQKGFDYTFPIEREENLISLCRFLHINDAKTLQECLKRNEERMPNLFKELLEEIKLPNDEKWATSFSFIAMLSLLLDNKEKFSEEELQNHGFDESIAVITWKVINNI